jgi:hypothetical protein
MCIADSPAVDVMDGVAEAATRTGNHILATTTAKWTKPEGTDLEAQSWHAAMEERLRLPQVRLAVGKWHLSRAVAWRDSQGGT